MDVTFECHTNVSAPLPRPPGLRERLGSLLHLLPSGPPGSCFPRALFTYTPTAVWTLCVYTVLSTQHGCLLWSLSWGSLGSRPCRSDLTEDKFVSSLLNDCPGIQGNAPKLHFLWGTLDTAQALVQLSSSVCTTFKEPRASVSKGPGSGGDKLLLAWSRQRGPRRPIPLCLGLLA